MSAVDTVTFVFNAFMFGKVAHFAVITIIVIVAVRVNDDAASVSRSAFLPVFTGDVFAHVLDAFSRFVINNISVVTFALFRAVISEDALTETAVEVAYFFFRLLGTFAVYVFFIVIDAFAVFFAVLYVAERTFAAFKRTVFVDTCRDFADCFRSVAIFAFAVDAAALVRTSASVTAAVSRAFMAFTVVVASDAEARTLAFMC